MKLEQEEPNLSPQAPGATADSGRAAAGYQQRHELGRAARREVPRGAHAGWTPAPDRPDPVDLLEVQARDRIPDLMPIRYARMMASPFAFMRGSAIVMASDLAGMPSTGIRAQLCGDAHLLNFGAAGRDNGFDASACRDAARVSVASYRKRMAEFSEMGELEVWYSRVGEDEVRALLSDAKSKKKTSRKMSKAVRKA